MRIISGTFKGRRIKPPQNLPVRPTTDFAKEGLFNLLNNRIDFEEINALDLFAGTGNITLELASRGAQRVTSVDINFKCLDFIKKVSRDLKIENIFTVKSNVISFLERASGSYDLIFADPPYDLEELDKIPNLIFNADILKKDGLFVLEHSKANKFEDHPRFEEHRKYGNVNFTFFK